MIEYNPFNFFQYGFPELKKVSVSIYKKGKLLEIPCSFDTEVTSFYDINGDKRALVYIWQFGVGDVIFYGREISDAVAMFKMIDNYLTLRGETIIVYVHNFKYDFNFIKALLEWNKLFFKSNLAPYYAITGNIEFRDSLILAGGRALKSIGKNLRKPLKKLVGDLDYEKIRTPITSLSDKEMGYCERDIEILQEYIREKMEDDGGLFNIPLTNIGYVRRYVKNLCLSTNGYLDIMDNLTITPDCYITCTKAFRGGVCGPNPRLRGKTVNGKIYSFDLKSAYPAVMVSKYFPMSYGHPISNKKANENFALYRAKYCMLFKACFENLEPKQNTPDYPLNYSKILHETEVGVDEIHGRIFTAEYCETYVTEIDFAILERAYTWTSFHIEECRLFKRGKLPKPITKAILHFFKIKTSLDKENRTEDEEREYLIAKNMLNAIYGMMVMKIWRDEYTYNTETLECDKSKPDIIEVIERYNNDTTRFLFYPWGLWITAHVHQNLYSAMFEVGAKDFVYCDTDCVKFKNLSAHESFFESFNSSVLEEMQETAKYYRFTQDEIFPVSPDGTRKYLGIFEHDHTYSLFKSLGPKHYLYRSANSNEYGLTFAGARSDGVLAWMKQLALYRATSIEDVFDYGLLIPKEYAGIQLTKVVNDRATGVLADYLGKPYKYDIASGVHMEAREYIINGEDETPVDKIKQYLARIEYNEVIKND